MARKRKSRPINGWLAIDKPLDLSSAAIVGRVRWILQAAKVGHGGTLDPLATGVLPIALGEATKTVSFVMDGAKTYRWTVRWGEARSTDDREGEITATSDIRPDRDQIEAALSAFRGEISQVPPIYSAIKIDGKRAYDLARADQQVEITPRIVRIDRFDLVSMPDSDHAEFIVECGKGTYIRSLARDLARALGTCGHIAALRRTACGPFLESAAISLDKLEKLVHDAPLAEYVLPVETALDDIPALALTEDEARRLASGQPVSVLHVASREPIPPIAPGQTLRAMDKDRVVALARIEGGMIRSVRVLNLQNTEGPTDVDYA